MDLNKAVNEVRKDEWRIATKDVRDNLHRSRFIFLRSNSTLKETHREKIDSLSCVARKTARAWASNSTLWSFGILTAESGLKRRGKVGIHGPLEAS